MRLARGEVASFEVVACVCERRVEGVSKCGYLCVYVCVCEKVITSVYMCVCVCDCDNVLVYVLYVRLR